MFNQVSIESINDLKEKFIKINKKGYIKGLKQNNKGNVGLTFELLIGKDNDEFPIADYNGIEIKVKNNFGYRYITLFSLVPSNCFGIELKKLRNNYGYFDTTYKNKKILMKSVFANKKVFLDNSFSFELKIKYNIKRIYLYIYDKNNKLLDNNIYWDFDDIINTIKRKLKTLALVKSNKKIINDIEYFHYKSINFYRLKDISIFFKLLEKGIIRLYICLGLYKSGPKEGQEHDHGITFGIKECDLLELYDEFNIK